ncbi:uncharacterized protein F4807DRAFT_83942 [Annulohypoxylon truncatum]|uniref:uncharacterized protein n=1 Tax=Annulohypoxylon truncatum TaxID=327061 RepID=UPI002007E576|nr:uncharacterized protein F4807DRAFT_83942 [Annulohypoxylon truncatum]KAI1209594.1 hypothetical protein F4807DRAFT_83942 [Annulohypoxylon truncatum]
MSNKTAPDAAKASGNGSQPSKAWSSEEAVKMLLLIMHHENPDLGVSGWKAIGEKAQVLFDGKYSMVAVKHQFQRLRRTFMAEIPANWKGDSDNDENEPEETSTRGKKRVAPTADEPSVKTPKAKKPRVAQKVTKGNKGPAKGPAKAATADASDGEERKTVKPMPQRRGAKKSQAKVDADKESRPTHSRATRKDSQKMVALESQSDDKTTTVDSQDNVNAATNDQAVADDPVADDHVAPDGIIADNEANDGAQVNTP